MILRKKSLVTVDILYWMPDYRNVLQEFIWQTNDIVPEIPRVHKFLNFWNDNIDAVISEIRVADAETNDYIPAKALYELR